MIQRTPGLAKAVLAKYGQGDDKSGQTGKVPTGTPETSDDFTPKHAAMMQLMHAVHVGDVNKAVNAMNGYMSHHEGTGDEAPDSDDDSDDDYDGDEID